MAQKVGRRLDRDPVRDELLTDFGAALGKEPDRLLAEAPLVPGGRHAARNAGDLRAVEIEPVVVELLAQSQPVGAALVEGEIDDRALRSQRLHRGVQRAAVGARLEHEVGAAIVAAMVPARLGVVPRVAFGHLGALGAGARSQEPAAKTVPITSPGA